MSSKPPTAAPTPMPAIAPVERSLPPEFPPPTKPADADWVDVDCGRDDEVCGDVVVMEIPTVTAVVLVGEVDEGVTVVELVVV